jgi:hypothetical protein
MCREDPFRCAMLLSCCMRPAAAASCRLSPAPPSWSPFLRARSVLRSCVSSASPTHTPVSCQAPRRVTSARPFREVPRVTMADDAPAALVSKGRRHGLERTAVTPVSPAVAFEDLCPIWNHQTDARVDAGDQILSSPPTSQSPAGMLGADASSRYGLSQSTSHWPSPCLRADW